MDSIIDMSTDNQDSEEILRDVSKSDYDMELSPVFSSRLKTFGSFPLTPTISLQYDESLHKEIRLSENDDIFGSQQLETVSSEIEKQYETPAACLMLPLSEKKLKKKPLKPVDYTVRPSCKRLQMISLNAPKGSSMSMDKKKRRLNNAKKEITTEISKYAATDSSHNLRSSGNGAKCTASEKLAKSSDNGNLPNCSKNYSWDNCSLNSPVLTCAVKWSPVSGCSPLSDSSSCCGDRDGLLDDASKHLSNFLQVPYARHAITSTPVDSGVKFDYNVSAITEGLAESSCGPFIFKESRFCISSELMWSQTYSHDLDEWSQSDKENIDPDMNRAAFDAFLRNRHIVKKLREQKIKCTYKRGGSKAKPLEELIQIHFSASQPVPIIQPETEDRLSHSQPEIFSSSRKRTLLSSGFDIVESTDPTFSKTDNGSQIEAFTVYQD